MCLAYAQDKNIQLDIYSEFWVLSENLVLSKGANGLISQLENDKVRELAEKKSCIFSQCITPKGKSNDRGSPDDGKR